MKVNAMFKRSAVGWPWVAAVLGLVTAAIPAPVLPQEVGRLFFSPQQRQDLDRRRSTNAAEEEAPTVENLVTVNGQVKRSSGRTTTWINGVPQDDAYRGSDAARVTVDGADHTVPVKVGETLDRGRGTVSHPLGSGTVRVKRGTPQ